MHIPPRSKSAPPFTLREVGPYFYLRDDEPFDLHMNPDDLARFSSITTLGRTHARVLMIVDNMILKLYPLLVDVSIIVQHMSMARTKMPVPEVYDHGYSGNCAYILMEKVEDVLDVADYLDLMKKKSVSSRVTKRVEEFVAALASLGLSHNDFHPRNIMVDRFWNVQSIVDWDDCASIHVPGEYSRRVMTREDTIHDWDHIFLRHASDRFAEIMLLTGGGRPRIPRRPPLARFPLGRPIGPT